MDARLKALLAEPDEDHVFTVTKDTHLPVRLSAEIVAKDVEQAIDIARHDLTEWKIESVSETEWPDIAEIRRKCKASERMKAKSEIATWRGIAIMFGVMWLVEGITPVLLQVLR
ncbi:MAG: hypothetical protein IOC42_02725 [Methylobacterium sp.]|nr:hypothetical protein [Methylobacterium sp.]